MPRPAWYPRDHEDGDWGATLCLHPPGAALRLSTRTITQVTRTSKADPLGSHFYQLPLSHPQALRVLLGITFRVNYLILNPCLKGCFVGDQNQDRDH